MKILIVGKSTDNHIKRLVTHLKAIDETDQLSFDVFDLFFQVNDKNTLYNKVYVTKHFFFHFLYRVKILRLLFNLMDVYFSFLPILKRRYDLVNVHSWNRYSFFLYPLYRIISVKIMISPWGSDVYRIGFFDKVMARFCYHQANCISVPPIKFRDDIAKIFNVSKNRFVNLGFGSDTIDAINMQKNLSKEEAKFKLGLEKLYVITCGYNASSSQNHNKILDAIDEIRSQLPDNICLVFPFTYGGTEQYKVEIEQRLKLIDVKYVIYTDYLSLDELVALRKSSDMFIHVQSSDAYSASVQEYLLCDVAVINASWLKYQTLEIFGKPYKEIDTFEQLPDSIIEILLGQKPVIPAELKLAISNNGWNEKAKDWMKFYIGNCGPNKLKVHNKKSIC